MAGNDFKLEDPTQYLDWASSVQGDLRADGLWTVVSRGNVLPMVTITNADGTTSTTRSTATISLRDSFEECDSCAVGVIQKRLTASDRTAFTDEANKSAKDLWDKIKSMYTTVNKVGHAFQIVTEIVFLRLNIPDGASNVSCKVIKEHVDKLLLLFSQLSSLGYDLHADLKSLFLLNTIPRTLAPSTLFACPSPTLRLLTASSSLWTSLPSSLRTQTEKAAEEAAHAARSLPAPASTFRCEFYGQNSTHAMKDCFDIKGAASRAEKRKKKKKPKEESGNAAAESDVEPALHVASVFAQSYKKVSAYCCA